MVKYSTLVSWLSSQVSAGLCVGEACDGPFARGCMAQKPLSPRSMFRVIADASALVSPPLDAASLPAMTVEFPSLRPGAMVFLGDTGAAIYGIRSGEHVYNRWPPRPEERFLQTANGHNMEVSFFGDLDVNFHSNAGGRTEDRIVTLENVAVTPGSPYILTSFSQSILLDSTGARFMGNRVHFSLLGNGDYMDADAAA